MPITLIKVQLSHLGLTPTSISSGGSVSGSSSPGSTLDHYYGRHAVTINSFAATEANKCCALQENVVSKERALYDLETTDQYFVDCKVLTINRVALV